MAENIGTSQSSGLSTTTIRDTHPLLLQELLSSENSGKPTGVLSVNIGKVRSSARTVASTSNSAGRGQKSTIQTYFNTSQKNSNPYFGDLNQNRGETGRNKTKVKELGQYMFENELFSQEDFKQHCFMRAGKSFRNPRAYELYLGLCERDWDKKLQSATDIARDHVPDISFKERLDNYQPPEDQSVELYGTMMYNDYIKLFQHHNLTRDKLQRWFKVLFSDNGKRNTIYMLGKSDAGKTTIIRLFDAFYYQWEIGRASAQNLNSNFWLQDLYEKRLFHCDEILATPINIDTMKLLLEGSTDLTTDIKYAKKVQIKPKPVMMATNDPLWINMGAARDPILRRCEYLHVTKPAPRGLKNLHLKDPEYRKFALWTLYKFCFPDGYETWKMDNEMYEEIVEMENEFELVYPIN